MRVLALLLVLGPSFAFAKHHDRDKPRVRPVVSSPSARHVEPVHTTAAVEQADDDEKPGSRQKK